MNEPKSVRLNLVISERVRALLGDHAQKSGLSMSEVIREASDKYSEIVKSSENGRHATLILRGSDGSERELTLFL